MVTAFLAAVGRLTTKAWRSGGGGGRRPERRVDGPNRGDRVRGMAPLYLEFMQARTPHFHWIATSLRCCLWLIAKRTGLWLTR